MASSSEAPECAATMQHQRLAGEGLKDLQHWEKNDESGIPVGGGGVHIHKGSAIVERLVG